jgi:hypothetical protein
MESQMEHEKYNSNIPRSLPLEPPTELSRRIDKELDADRAFFRRWPEREHYIRRIFPNERLQMEFLGRQFPPHDPLTHAVFVTVKKVHTNARMRTFFVAPRDIETDLSERDARAYWPEHSAEARQIVAALKATA